MGRRFSTLKGQASFVPPLDTRAVRFGQNHSWQPSCLFNLGAPWKSHPELDWMLGDLLGDGQLLPSCEHEPAEAAHKEEGRRTSSGNILDVDDGDVRRSLRFPDSHRKQLAILGGLGLNR